MALYLVQHGISAPKEIDPEKGLTERGVADTQRIAEVARDYGVRVARIIHSGKKRALQTATILQDVLSPDVPMEMVFIINPQDDVKTFAETVSVEANAMVVGHLPFLQRLVSFLTTGSEDFRIYQFQNSGIVCLDTGEGQDGKTEWFIKWTLNPHIS